MARSSTRDLNASSKLAASVERLPINRYQSIVQSVVDR